MALPSDKSGGKQSAMAETFAPLAILTVLAGGGGAFLGMTLAGVPPPPNATKERASHSEAPPAKPPCAAHGHGACEEAAPAGAHGAPAPTLALKTLAPIVTNLASPERTWIRMQCAVVYDAAELPHPDVLFALIMSDTIAYLRTLTLGSLEGAEGLRRLQEDLSERVATRSEGQIREYIIETLVVQ